MIFLVLSDVLLSVIIINCKDFLEEAPPTAKKITLWKVFGVCHLTPQTAVDGWLLHSLNALHQFNCVKVLHIADFAIILTTATILFIQSM